MVETNFQKINKDSTGQSLTVGGFTHTIRDHGGLIFIDLRSQTELLQCLIDQKNNSKLFELAQNIHPEYVLQITGIIRQRESKLINPNIPTGEVELIANQIKIISTAKTLPFSIHEEKGAGTTNEDLRLKYRYLDFRRKQLKHTITTRHQFLMSIRNWFNDRNFIEIPTPILANSSPEGARDYLVPSRLHQGKFYALPQSPQQFKQLLMVGGFNKYFQIAPCFRDEDPRSDRLIGDFYHIDSEIAWADEDSIFEICNQLINEVFSKYTNKELMDDRMIKITYDEAIHKYGSDKPDLRYDLPWINVKDLFVDSGFKVFADLATQENSRIQALVIKNSNNQFTRSDLDKIQDMGKQFELPGVAYIQYGEDGPKSPIFKFLGKDEEEISQKINEIVQKLELTKNDLVLFVANQNKEIVQKATGKIRTHIAQKLNLINDNLLRFVWIHDFPFFEMDEEKNINFAHNPFGLCQGGIEAIKKAKKQDKEALLELKAHQYDIAVNGFEVLSGGVRNPDPKALIEVFNLVGYSTTEVQNQFGHMLEAYEYGAPNHAGFAWGIPRLLMVLLGEENVREVVPFPKNGSGIDPLTNSPSEIKETQLKEIGLKIDFD
ncbi:aspartate--tRNA ligase [Candidatus Gracilibacteria bacterium]|nr:aspartate--tRNA ligase [Candidatus Gracilibacteria bacterium]